MVKIYGLISNIRAGHLKIDIRDFRTILLIILTMIKRRDVRVTQTLFYQHQKYFANVMCQGKKPKKCARSKLQAETVIVLWFAAR